LQEGLLGEAAQAGAEKVDEDVAGSTK
jgi:hypothetical protein